MKKMKHRVVIYFIVILILILTGCKPSKNENLTMTLEPKELTSMENMIVSSTPSEYYYIGKINNLPKEKEYRMEVFEEYYKNNELKRRENSLTTGIYDVKENSQLYITISIGREVDNESKIVPLTIGTYNSNDKEPYSGGSASTGISIFDLGEVAYSSLEDKVTFELGRDITIMGFSSNNKHNTSSFNLSSTESIKDGIKRNKEVRLIKIRISKYNENEK